MITSRETSTHLVLLLVGVIAALLFVAWGMLGMGCNAPVATYTTATVVSVTGVPGTDIETLRAQYWEVAECWGIVPDVWQSVAVRIMVPSGTDSSGAQWFVSPECEAALKSNGLWPEYTGCYGCIARDWYPQEVQVPPDLGAFRHDVSHVVMPGKGHGEGCWL